MLSRCKCVWSLPLRTTLRRCSTGRTEPVLDIYRRNIVSKQSVNAEFDLLLGKYAYIYVYTLLLINYIYIYIYAFYISRDHIIRILFNCLAEYCTSRCIRERD